MNGRTWPRRQLTAMSGLIPLVLLIIGGAVGAAVAEAVGVPVAVGAVIGAVAGYFASRAVLRQLFVRDV